MDTLLAGLEKTGLRWNLGLRELSVTTNREPSQRVWAESRFPYKNCIYGGLRGARNPVYWYQN